MTKIQRDFAAFLWQHRKEFTPLEVFMFYCVTTLNLCRFDMAFVTRINRKRPFIVHKVI